MRTTITVDDQVLADAKAQAAKSGKTLSAIVEEALREALARRRQPPDRPRRVELPVFRGGRLLPGVDLDDSATLLDLMEGIDT